MSFPSHRPGKDHVSELRAKAAFSRRVLAFSVSPCLLPWAQVDEQVDLRVAAGAAPFNHLCRVYAPRYRQVRFCSAQSVLSTAFLAANPSKLAKPLDNCRTSSVPTGDQPFRKVNVVALALYMPPSPAQCWEDDTRSWHDSLNSRMIQDKIPNGERAEGHEQH